MSEYANYNTVAAYVSAKIVEAYTSLLIGRGFTLVEETEVGSDSKSITVDTAFTASTVAEGDNAPITEDSEDKVNITAAKSVVYTEPTLETEIFVGSAKIEKIIRKSIKALEQKWAKDFATNFATLSTGAGATGQPFTFDAFLQATYLLDLADANGYRASFLSTKQLLELVQDLKANGSRALDEAHDGLFSRNANRTALRGALLDIPIFASNNISNDGTDFAGGMIEENCLGSLEVNGLIPNVDIGKNIRAQKHEINVNSFWGFTEVKDAGGVKLVSGV